MDAIGKVATTGFLALALTACATHPLPEDYAGVSTYAIVRQIRCETREAVKRSIFDFLADERNATLNKVDDASRKIGRHFRENPKEAHKFSPASITGNARPIVDLIWKTGIAYNYSLEMTETNNLGGDLNLLNALPTSNKMFGFKAGLNRQRQNTRSFTVTDTFGELVGKVPETYCSEKFIAQDNIIYPIAGKVGIEPVIQEFVLLSLFGNLSGNPTEQPWQPKGPPTLAEQLEFQTTLTASATPKVTFAPLTAGMHLADASFTADVTRKDVHKLTIGLYVPMKDVAALADSRVGLFGSLITAAGSKAELGAANAAAQLLTQKLLQQQILIQR